jgi:hypothetical protein
MGMNECSFIHHAMSTGVVIGETRVAFTTGSRVQGFRSSEVLQVHGSGFGTEVAMWRCMGANDFTDLFAWQRADALERFALEMIKRPGLAGD